MKKILLFNLLLAMTFVTTSLKAADGDVFTHDVRVINNYGTTTYVPMRFKVISESNKTCFTFATYDEISHTYGPAINTGDTYGKLIIPSAARGYTVIKIGDYSFENCRFSEIEIPSTISSIGEYAFHRCTSLNTVNVPSKVSLGDHAFDACSGMKSISISCDVIPWGCFVYCGLLETINLLSPVKHVQPAAFISCNRLKQITFPAGLEDIGEFAFSQCSDLETIFFPRSLNSIASTVFVDCSSLRNVTIARETPPTITENESDYAASNLFSWSPNATLLTVPDRTKYNSAPWTQFSEIRSFPSAVEQTTTYARCYINGSSEYNALGLFMGSNDAIKNILDLKIDGVHQMPVMENSYLILTDNLKNIPLEVSYVLKTDDGIQPYIHHYHQVNYGISINGKQMTSVDMYNIPCLKSGKAHFEDERSGYYWANKPTLVLENATLECDGSTGVDNGHYGSTFNIKVVGDCTISGKGEMFNPLYLDSETSTTIKGGGTLNLISANESGKAGDAIYSGMEARLTLTDYTTLIATSIDNSGYWDEGEGRFTIDSGYFCAYSEKSYPLWLPSQLLLGQGVDLRYPVGGQVLGNYVYGADGAPVQGGWVMFGYDTQVMDELITGVASPKSSPEGNDFIYNLAGQRLSKTQKGVNIVGGRKVLIK